MKRFLLFMLACLPAIVLAGNPVPVQAQGSPTFRLDGWSTDPSTLQRGQEFDLKVTFTNVGGENAVDVSVTIGQGGTFVGLDVGDFFGQIDDGDKETARLRVAVSNTITTGHYSIPVQISYRAEGGSTTLSEVKNIGIFVEGLTPQGQDVGEPDFEVDDWSLQPETLQRGQEFTLTLTFRNIGTWDGNDVVVDIGQGQQFIGLQASPTIPSIQIGATQSVSIRGAVSNTIITGHYDLPVQFTYHHAAQGGQRISATKTLGVYVEGIAPSTGTDTGRPQLVIEESKVQPGEEEGSIALTLTLHNTGNRWARAVIVNLGPSEIFSPAEGSSAIALEGDIKVDERKEVTLPLVLLRSPEGRFTQDFTVEYGSYSGGSYQTTERVPIALSGEAIQSPHLLVETYRAEPAPITPGATFSLMLLLTNVGAGPADQVFVRLNELGPLAPVDSSNVRFIESIPAGDQIEVAYQLAADGSASTGQVALNVDLTYQDAFGVETQETVTISLRIQEIPHFHIGLFEPISHPVEIGDTFELPVEIINIGENRVNVSTVDVASDDLEIQDGSIYIGPLDGGTSGTLVPMAKALSPGNAEISVMVHYLDSFQQSQTITEILTIQVEGNPEDAEAAGADDEAGEETEPENLTFGQRLWRGIIGFLGLGTRPTDDVEVSLP